MSKKKKIEFKKIKYSNLSKLYMSANGFKSTFESLKKQSTENLGVIQYENTTPATATNGFFALELYLKLIYSFDYWEKIQRGNENCINETQYPKGHNLYDLYNLLENPSKRKVLEKISSEMSDGEVVDFFQKFSEGFENWRYYFETIGGMEGDFYSLNIILTAVYDYCKDYVNNKMHMPEEWIENGFNTSVTMHKAKVSSLEELNELQSKKLSELI